MVSDYRGQAGLSRGIRNNNPGNVRKGIISWKGQVGDDGSFVIFSDMAFGIRAMLMVYHTYLVKHGVKTLRDYIYRYAPPSDNNPTAVYLAAVSAASGLQPSDAMPHDPAIVELILRAQVSFESGGDSSHITDADFAAGFALFNGSYADFFFSIIEQTGGTLPVILALVAIAFLPVFWSHFKKKLRHA